MDSEKFEHPRRSTRAPSIALALLAPIVAVAHVGQGDIGAGLIAGVEHPIFGFDHVVAMVAVGIWGAVLGPPAIWVLPVTFPLVMAFGGVLGRLGVPIPGVEIGIAASAIVLGSMVHGRIRRASAAVDRRGVGRRFCDLPRLRTRCRNCPVPRTRLHTPSGSSSRLAASTHSASCAALPTAGASARSCCERAACLSPPAASIF